MAGMQLGKDGDLVELTRSEDIHLVLQVLGDYGKLGAQPDDLSEREIVLTIWLGSPDEIDDCLLFFKCNGSYVYSRYDAPSMGFDYFYANSEWVDALLQIHDTLKE